MSLIPGPPDKPRILIVEDHPVVRRSLQEWLEENFVCCISTAASGEEAIAVAQSRAPDVVVLDIDLPGVNGIEATQRIKAIAPNTRVVILTSYEEETFRLRAAAAGANAYVPKRAMQTELLPALAALL